MSYDTPRTQATPASTISFATTTDLIAKERAGNRRGPPHSRHAVFRAVDDRPDVLVPRETKLLLYPSLLLSSLKNFSLYSHSWNNVADSDCRYEAILLAPGENKIDVEVDTRESFILK